MTLRKYKLIAYLNKNTFKTTIFELTAENRIELIQKFKNDYTDSLISSINNIPSYSNKKF